MTQQYGLEDVVDGADEEGPDQKEHRRGGAGGVEENK